jgi:PAS domain S-box-containing protein
MAAVRVPVTEPDQPRDEAIGAVGPTDAGWRSLFSGAFVQSKNPMVLLDERRRQVEVNGAYLRLLGYSRAALIGHPLFEFVIGGPVASSGEWRAALRRRQFTAVGDLRREDGGRVRVEFAGHPAVVTGRPLVLFVALSTSRRGRQLPGPPADQPTATLLSARELQIVRLIALGANGPEIAEELHVTHNTVRTHVRNAMTKLGTRSRAQLVAKLLGEGLIWTEQS